MNPARDWFGPKRIGWGLSPRTWEGWLLTLIAAAIAMTPGFIMSAALRHPSGAVLDRLR